MCILPYLSGLSSRLCCGLVLGAMRHSMSFASNILLHTVAMVLLVTLVCVQGQDDNSGVSNDDFSFYDDEMMYDDLEYGEFYNENKELHERHFNEVADKNDLPTNKFTQAQALKVDEILFGKDGAAWQGKSECPIDLELVWSHQMESSVYSTPLIQRLTVDGKKHVIVPTFENDLHLLDRDGHSLPGWPFSQPNTFFHTSPVLFDTNGDGSSEFVWISVNGEIMVVNGDPSMEGSSLSDAPRLPKLKVRKEWYKGLRDDVQEVADPAQDKDNQQAKTDPPPARRLLQIDPEFNKGVDEKKLSEEVGTRETTPEEQFLNGEFANSLTPEALAALQEMHMQDGMNSQLDLEIMMDMQKLEKRKETEESRRNGEKTGPAKEEENFPTNETFVYVDPHVLVSPVVVKQSPTDVLLVIPVSYYFDVTDENNKSTEGIDPSKYVGGGLIVWDWFLGSVKWQQNLDLSTEDSLMRAYIYSTPTVVDLDGDGWLEVIVGSSMGFIYVFNLDDGSPVKGFPIFMSEIQSQITAVDLNDDGKLEMVVCDKKGNVLCFDLAGKELWSTQISGFSSQAATVGDINGDGVLDVVLSTVSGHIWALNGQTGQALPHFPFKTAGKILAPILLVNLHKPTQTKNIHPPLTRQNDPWACPTCRPSSLHLVVPCFCGHVYIIDGGTGCFDQVDIGEHSYSMVLTDDVLGRGKMDLVVSTMSGNVYLFATEVPFHPLKAWTSQAQGLNGFVALEGYMGIVVSKASRVMRAVNGPTLTVEFVIVDNRADMVKAKAHYRVKISLIYPMWNNKDEFQYVYKGPQTESSITVTVPAPDSDTYVNVVVEMRNEHEQLFSDSYTIGANLHFYKVLKYLTAIPCILLGVVVLGLGPSAESFAAPRDKFIIGGRSKDQV